MKALTIHQPWGAALATGMKQYETRPRQSHHRGLLAIHAGKVFNADGFANVSHLPFNEHIEVPLSRRWSGLAAEDFPTGVILAVAELTDCIQMDEDLIASVSDQERSLGDWQVGRWAYKLENVQVLQKPVAASGKQGMWNWEPTEDDLEGITLPKSE